jgi:hypothetical protein
MSPPSSDIVNRSHFGLSPGLLSPHSSSMLLVILTLTLSAAPSIAAVKLITVTQSRHSDDFDTALDRNYLFEDNGTQLTSSQQTAQREDRAYMQQLRLKRRMSTPASCSSPGSLSAASTNIMTSPGSHSVANINSPSSLSAVDTNNMTSPSRLSAVDTHIMNSPSSLSAANMNIMTHPSSLSATAPLSPRPNPAPVFTIDLRTPERPEHVCNRMTLTEKRRRPEMYNED